MRPSAVLMVQKSGMIQHTIATWQDLSWQDALKSLITDPQTLLEHLELSLDWLPEAHEAAKSFPLRVTQHFVDQIQKGDIDDPLLKQILPLGQELKHYDGYHDDPLNEQNFTPKKGLLHKYKNRVLVIATSSCAINCRYCFRRTFDYTANRLSKDDWHEIFTYIASTPEIDEVIFSGGDPLLHSDKHFEWLFTELAKIDNLERIRIHSRLPIVLPQRLTPKLLASFAGTRLHPVLVVHSNHANEISDEVSEALISAVNEGITVLNQSVLLKGVNDSAEAQIQLAKTLFNARVLPYYLHMLDRVNGVGHFEVDKNKAVDIYRQMQNLLPGYLVPKLVREEAGEASKTTIPL